MLININSQILSPEKMIDLNYNLYFQIRIWKADLQKDALHTFDSANNIFSPDHVCPHLNPIRLPH